MIHIAAGPWVAVAVAVLFTALLAPATATAAAPRPDPRGSAAIVIDADSGETLLAERADERHPIASATKLMTALLTLEGTNLSDEFRAARYSALPAESRINLRPGERMRVRDLLVALLLESANDASVTLAERIAGSRAAFVERMNSRARELRLRSTRYANPVGLDDRANYSSARDLAALARRLMGDARFRRIVDRPTAELRSGARPRTVSNRNRLVAAHPFVTGVKTGHTIRARYVLVGSASGGGARVISVVLGEPSEAARDADSLALLRWGLGQFRRVGVVERGRTFARADVRYFDGRRVPLAAGRSIDVTLRRGERAVTRLDAPRELTGPLPRGRRVGTVLVRLRGRTVASAPLVTAAAVPEAGFLRRLFTGVSLAFALGALVLGAGGLTVLAARRARGRRRRVIA